MRSYVRRYHILANHSIECATLWNKVDYVGIIVLMWGGCIPTIYFGLYCDPMLRLSYLVAVSWSASLYRSRTDLITGVNHSARLCDLHIQSWVREC